MPLSPEQEVICERLEGADVSLSLIRMRVLFAANEGPQCTGSRGKPRRSPNTLPDRLIVRTAGGIRLTACHPNRVQAKSDFWI
jgi:hypothetical protein